MVETSVEFDDQSIMIVFDITSVNDLFAMMILFTSSVIHAASLFRMVMILLGTKLEDVTNIIG